MSRIQGAESAAIGGKPRGLKPAARYAITDPALGPNLGPAALPFTAQRSSDRLQRPVRSARFKNNIARRSAERLARVVSRGVSIRQSARSSDD